MTVSTIPATQDQDSHADAGPGPLRVLLALGNHGLALADDAAPGAEPAEIRFRRNVGRPLPGDLVQVDEQGAVARIEPRAGEFGRGGARGRFQPVAANVDTLLIVIAPEPTPSVDLLHRYVAAARIQGIEPVMVINKSDLGVPDAAPFDQIDDLDVSIHHTHGVAPADLDGLDQRTGHGIHLLAGQSGVGKSSLANALLPDLDLQTERLSRATGKGRHTTTSARLFRLPECGWLIDSPGVWEYGLWKMPLTTLARGFPEFAALPPCRFRDCKHLDEPGCQIRAAAESGALPESRYRAWLSLLREQERL